VHLQLVYGMLYQRDSMDDERDNRPAGQGLRINEAHWRRVNLQEEGYLQLVAEATSRSKEARYTDPEENFWHYRSKPRWVTATYGLLAVLFIIGQLWLEELNVALGEPLTYIGLWRFGVFLLGGYCAFIAWPYYVHVSDNRRNPPPRMQTRR